MSTQTTPLSFRAVLEIPALRRLWIGQIVSVFGDFLAIFAVIGFATYTLHANAAQITGVSIAFILPLALFGPVAGVFVDRWPLKATMVTSDLTRAVLALLLIVAPSLHFIYAILFALSFVSSFFIPAQSVTIRSIVPREGLLAANALMQQAMQVMRIVSPAIAGAMVGSLSANSCYWADAASFAVSAWMIFGMRFERGGAGATPPAAPQGGSRLGSVWRELFAGARFIFTHPAVSFVIVSMAAALFVMGCFGPLIAVYVRDFLHAGPVLFGMLSALIGVGMIAGTQGLHRFARGRSNPGMVVTGLAIIGVAVLAMAAVRHAAFTAIGTFGTGLGVAFILIPAQTLLQQETPVEMVGRVSSSTMSVLTLSQVLGLGLSGSLAAWIGIRMLFAACGAAMLAIGALGLRRVMR